MIRVVHSDYVHYLCDYVMLRIEEVHEKKDDEYINYYTIVVHVLKPRKKIDYFTGVIYASADFNLIVKEFKKMTSRLWLENYEENA